MTTKQSTIIAPIIIIIITGLKLIEHVIQKRI